MLEFQGVLAGTLLMIGFTILYRKVKQKQVNINKNSCQTASFCGKGGYLLPFMNERQCIEVMLSLHNHLPTRQLQAATGNDNLWIRKNLSIRANEKRISWRNLSKLCRIKK